MIGKVTVPDALAMASMMTVFAPLVLIVVGTPLAAETFTSSFRCNVAPLKLSVSIGEVVVPMVPPGVVIATVLLVMLTMPKPTVVVLMMLPALTTPPLVTISEPVPAVPAQFTSEMLLATFSVPPPTDMAPTGPVPPEVLMAMLILVQSTTPVSNEKNALSLPPVRAARLASVKVPIIISTGCPFSDTLPMVVVLELPLWPLPQTDMAPRPLPAALRNRQPPVVVLKVIPPEDLSKETFSVVTFKMFVPAPNVSTLVAPLLLPPMFMVVTVMLLLTPASSTVPPAATPRSKPMLKFPPAPPEFQMKLLNPERSFVTLLAPPATVNTLVPLPPRNVPPPVIV